MNKIIAILLMAMTLFALGGCAEKAAPTTGALQPLTIGTMPDVDSIPFLIAAEKGYFKDEGLTVHLKPFKSAMDRDSALQSGNLDGAVSDILAVAFAKSGGFDVKITSLTSGSYKLLAGKSELASSIQELGGKEIAISKNTIIEYVTDQMLSGAGMAENSVQKIVIPQIPTRLELLQNGKLAAATLPEPMASIAIQNGAKLMASSDQHGIFPGILMFTGQTIETKQEELKAMYRAYNKAVEYLNQAPKEHYMDLLIDKGGFPPAVKDALTLPKYKKAERPAKRDIHACMQWLTGKKLIKQIYTDQDIIDDRFVR